MKCNFCDEIASVNAQSEPFGWRRNFCGEHIPNGWNILKHYKEAN